MRGALTLIHLLKFGMEKQHVLVKSNIVHLILSDITMLVAG